MTANGVPRYALSAPAGNAAAITPSDSADLSVDARSIYVGVGGDIALIPIGGRTAVTFKNAAAGSVIPVQTARVMSTNTTATNLVALW